MNAHDDIQTETIGIEQKSWYQQQVTTCQIIGGVRVAQINCSSICH